MRAMRQLDRHELLLSRLRSDGSATVAGLARDMGVTPSTIRRDLAALADGGRLLRTYGGAALASARVGPAEVPALEAKRRIAAAAATQLVEDGQTIVVASGTTTLELARRLVDRRLTVITNALDVAAVLVDREGIELVVLGGVVRPRMHSMLGHLAELASQELRADAIYMGIGAISLEHGLMNDSIPEILTDRALRRIARQVVVLADSSKFDLVAPAFVFGLEEVDVLVTDAAVRPALVRALEGRGLRVVVAR
jgi:DeoR/GlpR family transcriptional regulator of sugar metabolism